MKATEKNELIEKRVFAAYSDYCYHNGIIPEDVVVDRALNLRAEFDSLDMLEFMMCIEEDFDIDILDSDAEKMKTLGDVVDLITGLKLTVRAPAVRVRLPLDPR